MRVRMLIQISGTRNGQPWPAKGGTVDLPDAEAKHLCESGIAEAVKTPKKTESATTNDAPETATKSTTPKGRKSRAK